MVSVFYHEQLRRDFACLKSDVADTIMMESAHNVKCLERVVEGAARLQRPTCSTASNATNTSPMITPLKRPLTLGKIVDIEDLNISVVVCPWY